MTDPFDPVEDWLSTDVELMAARPGTFELVHRRARRRKTTVATMTAAGAAVLIAAAVAVPQLASSLLPGHGGRVPDRVNNPQSSSSHTHSTRPSPTQSRSARPHPHRSSSAPASGGGLSILSSSAAPAARFEPTSITFVNDAVGAVLGQTTAGCPAGSAGLCLAMAGTSDYGQSWTKVDTPPAGPPSGGTGVSQVRFLNGDNGWAYGPELYATHSGGATWTKIGGLKGRVIDLATVGDQAYAVVATCTGSGSDYAAGCTRFSLYSTFYDSDDWQPVAGANGSLAVRPGGLQLTSQYGYLLASSTLFVGSPGGGAWQKVTPASGLVPECLKATSGSTGLIAPGANSDLYLLCLQAGGGSPALYTSADAGQTWQSSGAFHESGLPASLAVAPTSGTLVAATGSGLFYSPVSGSSGGRSWHRAGTGGGPAPTGGFSFAGMTTTMEGVAIPADTSLREIFITKDGGLTWAAKAVS